MIAEEKRAVSPPGPESRFVVLPEFQNSKGSLLSLVVPMFTVAMQISSEWDSFVEAVKAYGKAHQKDNGTPSEEVTVPLPPCPVCQEDKLVENPGGNFFCQGCATIWDLKDAATRDPAEIHNLIRE